MGAGRLLFAMPITVSIASPCSEAWSAMHGDDRVRACARCQLNVFNVAALTEAELRALFLQAGAGVCGRVYRRPDGTVLTRDCPTGVATARRKAVRAALLVVTFVVAVVGVRLRGATPLPQPGGEGSWFTQLFEARFIAAREALRQTQTFGPLVDELSPRQLTMGRMVMIRKISGP